MPLAFPCRSHGQIAFGFFNIEIDMLLLERLFFFAETFCRAILELARKPDQLAREVTIDGWSIDDPGQIGSLHGAIRGDDLGGFIGSTYKRFPFPAEPAAFKQNPDGANNRAWAQEEVARFGRPEKIRIRWDAGSGCVSIGEFIFEREVFSRLVDYVEHGGYPRWKSEIRPPYVLKMVEQLSRISSPFFLDPTIRFWKD